MAKLAQIVVFAAFMAIAAAASYGGVKDLAGNYYDYSTGQYSSSLTGKVYNTAPYAAPYAAYVPQVAPVVAAAAAPAPYYYGATYPYAAPYGYGYGYAY